MNLLDSALVLHPHDSVAIARRDLASGTLIALPSGGALVLPDTVPAGHKFALRALGAGAPILRYGYPIGFASRAIAPGEWVHTHNVAMGDERFATEWTVVHPLEIEPARADNSAHDTFLGYARPDGAAGTRNYIAVISTVNCSAHVTVEIARHFTAERLAASPNVDGVIPLVHTSGCGLALGGLGHTYLQRTLSNVAHNPNVGGYCFVGLGCEVNQIDAYCAALDGTGASGSYTVGDRGFVIQEGGGFSETVEAGVRAVERLIASANITPRTPQPVSALTLALQCGGSDGWSGITANPLVGRVVDRVVRQGGTAVLSETPEVHGAERLLISRVTRPEVAERLLARLKWWSAQAQRYGFKLDNNPSPGNKRGGLTTIWEKSLGTVAKGGSTPLNAVYEYAERVIERGLVFMDTPGYDPVSATGQLAGGCNLILFTTGRGSVYSSNLAPCVKIASNSALAARMADDMDWNAGALLEGMSWEEAEEGLYRQMLAAASGARTAGERHGLPEYEFVPWAPGAVV